MTEKMSRRKLKLRDSLEKSISIDIDMFSPIHPGLKFKYKDWVDPDHIP